MIRNLRVRVGKLETGLASVNTETVALKTQFAEMHLTAADRELLGLPSSEAMMQKAIDTVVAGQVQVLVAAQVAKEKKNLTHPSEIESCGDEDWHDWSRKYWDIPMRKYNQSLLGDDHDDNRAYLRKCMTCGTQQALHPGQNLWHDD
jgi:hypothetical protein